MNLTRSLRLAFAVLLGAHLLMAFGAVALLGRMKPAIQRIIDDNVQSLEAAEEMLSVLAAAGGDTVPDADRERYVGALERAKSNVTDARERPVLEGLEREAPLSLAGDPAARRASVEGLRSLAAINRDDLVRSDRQAQQLGTAGAWSMVFLAVLTLIGALVAVRRLDHRVLQPIEELYEVVSETRAGQQHRRCRQGLGAAGELGEIMQEVNTLLDRRDEALAPTPEEEADDRAVARHLLDERAEPALVLDARGRVVAANAAGLDLLTDRPGLDEALRDHASRRTPIDGFTITPVAEGRRFVVGG